MSLNNFNIFYNLIAFILYCECFYFFITLVKVQTVLLIEKLELYSFMDGGAAANWKWKDKITLTKKR